MVNGNYVLYGDRPSSETEVIDDHVHSRTAERKSRRKLNRTANELQRTLNMTHLDNETDAVKYERNQVKEPKLLRYVPTTEVEQNYITAKFETAEEPPRRYAFTKKPKNPTDGSVHYAYSRSSSSCSSPGGNLPTISEHGEQYGTYRVRAPSSPVRDLVSYDRKLDKYFVKPREPKKFLSTTGYNGSHPDSLYRVPATADGKGGRVARIMRLLRWPMALIVTCVALALFVYFLMPDTIQETESDVVNGTFWETGVTGASSHLPKILEHNKSVIPVSKSPEKLNSSEGTKKPSHGTKTTEIDFYDIAGESNVDIHSLLDKIRDTKANRKLPVMPVYPSHIAPEVQYGNEKADEDNTRTPKTISDNNLVPAADSTVKPHITQKPEKPLAIYFKENDAEQTSTETFASSQATNNFGLYDGKTNRNIIDKVQKPYTRQEAKENLNSGPEPEILQYRDPVTGININFTSSHSKLFGISIEDAERFKSTTPSTVYNTKVSPTLPVWTEGDDTTTKKYPNNSGLEGQPQCRSTQLALCRGVLPYDLAMMGTTKVGDLDVITLLPQIEYMVATNCSARFKQFACALLESECSAPPNPPKIPCNSLCKSVLGSCDGYIPLELSGMFKCAQYPRSDCHSARSPCNSFELQCGDGSCVPRDWICDGRKDCPAGEDEAKCVACTHNEFRCRTGDCIMKSWLCDGYEDCPDGDDERQCSAIGESALLGSPSGALSGPDASTLLGAIGEELAGSAPAPSVRMPNVVSPETIKTTNSHRAVIDYESSKELLMTSDSTNALKRNYTRRPSPSRLTPYSRTTRMPYKKRKSSKTTTTTTSTSTTTTQKPVALIRTAMTAEQRNQVLENLKIEIEKEDFDLGDRDIFAEMRRRANDQAGIIAVSSKQRVPAAPDSGRLGLLASGASPIQEAVVGQNLTGNGLNQTVSKLERILNGQELMRKASKALEDATTPPDEDDVSPRKGKRGEDESEWSAEAYSSHSSPCPAGELRCVDGRCITLAQLCDGTIDCSDHADEDNCYT